MRIRIEGKLEEIQVALQRLKGIEGVEVTVLEDLEPEIVTVKTRKAPKKNYAYSVKLGTIFTEKKKRTMSPAAKAKIAAAQKARWAKVRKAA